MKNVLYSNEVNTTLKTFIEGGDYNLVMVLVDNNTRQLVLPHIACLSNAHVIEMPSGDEGKNIDSLMSVWRQMEHCGATRRSLLVNLGGGVVTDLGGLAAATFKRGIHFVNVPTTLLAAVDASVGGKTGINFMGLKNEIGVFAHPQQVIVSTCFFNTLPQQEIKSGFAEVLKHAMLSSHKEMMTLLEMDINSVDWRLFLDKLQASVEVKLKIVDEDPTEQGLRKSLNLGHTVGHAFESMALAKGKPVPHGWAVAWGLVVEAVLSHMKLQFPSGDLYSLARFVVDCYGPFHFTCDDYDELISLMRHDKKSTDHEINCSLLKKCGDVVINYNINLNDMKAAFDIYRDLMGV